MDKQEKVKIMISELRKLFPVVTTSLHYSQPHEFLFAVMMSAQNTDKGVNKVTDQLFKKYKRIEDFTSTSLEELDLDMKAINYHTTKARNILASAKIIQDEYNGKIPDSMELLLRLPGVGRKTANVVLGNIFHQPVGIAVDTHVKRLSKLYGLTKHSDVVKIENDLLKIVPQGEWTDFTHLMIEYGRMYCPARKHDHNVCPLTKALKTG